MIVDPNTPKEEGVTRVLIAIPTMGYPQVESYCNRLMNFMYLGKLEERGKLKNLTPRFEFFFAVMGRIFTPLAREEAAQTCIDWDCDYLYMIDDDMTCPDDMFERLYAHNVDVVAPLAFTRNYPHKPVVYSCIEGYDHVTKKDYFLNQVVMNYPRDQLVECDAVGFGAALIKRSIIDKIPTPRFMSSCGTGEDILFCYNAKKVGGRIFSDTSLKIGHLSHPTIIDEPYADAVRGKDELFNMKHTEYNKYTKLVMGD